jgi:aspartyl-tRNA synthetase
MNMQPNLANYPSGAVGLRDAYVIELPGKTIGTAVTVCGWIQGIREHGEKLSFVDLRDATGTVQCVIDSRIRLRIQDVVMVRGTIAKRPPGTENETLATGTIELRDVSVEVLNPAEPLPLPLEEHLQVDELTRLRYRYLDLRREQMQFNLRLRARMNSAFRRAMERQGFVEIETPLLWTPTPEGAREFLVPSRGQPGNFYVLPQSPQIAKQLLMVAGFDRYYQIARCLRDEDLRADRQFEFTQLDLEASFVTQKDVRNFVSNAVAEVMAELFPEYETNFDEITWQEAMSRYGSDKPDRRFGHELIDLTDVFETSNLRALKAQHVAGLVSPQSLTRSKLDALVDRAKSLGAQGLAWLRIESTEPQSISSPLAKHLTEDEVKALIDRTGAQPGDTVLLVADKFEIACSVLGQVRLELGRQLADPGVFDFFWVIDFPLFEGLDEDGNPVSAHHPFTMPNEEDLAKLESDPLSVRSQSYDLVLNGWELGSGSIRIHRRDIQERIFATLGIDEDTAKNRFGFLLDAFRYGAPPHGGFAIGLDRLAALLVGADSIREVIAFPKTQSGTDPMTGAPKEVPIQTLLPLGIKLSRH